MLDALSETFNTGHHDFVNATYIPALPEISSCASDASGSQLNSMHASISSSSLRRKHSLVWQRINDAVVGGISTNPRLPRSAYCVGNMAVFRCQPSRASLVGRHQQGEQGDCQ
jgi:hypothetical protein